MVLPAIIGTGLKIFQATRRKASSGSDVASKIVSKQTTVTGKSVGKPKSGAIIRSSSSKISGARFLKSTTDPSKDKIKAKEGVLQQFASIINSINKFLSVILRTLIADNKLSKRQFENERKAEELVVKRQRESNLESDQDETTEGVPSSKSKSKRGSFFDRIIKFISSIIIGSLVLALYRNFTRIIQFFKETYETIVGFFDKLGEYMSPLWEVFKFIAKFSSPLLRIVGNDDKKYADLIEKEDNFAIKELSKDISNQKFSVDEDSLGERLKAEADDDSLAAQIARGDIMPSMFTPIEDRSFAKNMIKEHEGFKLKVYKDSKGFSTVGYGHKIDADSPIDIRNLKEGDEISKDRADRLFDMDFNDHLNAARKIPGFNKASKKQQAALIDLTFNMGPNWYKGFPSFTKAFAAGDYEEAARQIEFADPVNKPGVKSGYVQDVGPRRSDPILNLIKGKGVGDSPHLKNIMKLLGEHSNKLDELSNSISSISTNSEEDEGDPVIVYVPSQNSTTGGGSGSSKIIPIVTNIDNTNELLMALRK
jgi:lysozyme